MEDIVYVPRAPKSLCVSLFLSLVSVLTCSNSKKHEKKINYFLLLSWNFCYSEVRVPRSACLASFVLFFEFLLYVFILGDIFNFIFHGTQAGLRLPGVLGSLLTGSGRGAGGLAEASANAEWRETVGCFPCCIRSRVATPCHTPVIWLRRFPDMRPIGKSQPGRFRFK